MPPGQTTTALSSFQTKHPEIYSILHQSLLLIVTYYCAVGISRYGPESDTYNPSSLVPGVDILRPPSSAKISTTPHICPDGAREDLVDVRPLAAITPHLILCPSITIFILSLLMFPVGIYRLNALATIPEDKLYVNLTPGAYAGLVGFTVVYIDWKNILVSLQILVPIYVWCATVIGVLLTQGVNWVMRMYFSGRRSRDGELERAKRRRINLLRGSANRIPRLEGVNARCGMSCVISGEDHACF